VDQSDEPRSLRPRLIPAKSKSVNLVLSPVPVVWTGKNQVVAFPA
jgi:hypothetical protein